MSETTKSVIWHVMMVIWFAGLLYGLWWVWPNFERMALTADLVMSVLWLAMGFSAWLLALNFGRARYWPRR
jgi:hypothetical protein